MHRGFFRFLIRRVLFAIALIVVVSSASLILATVAPDEAPIGADPAAHAAERHRLGLDLPLHEQYIRWLGRTIRFDLGESLHYRRPVSTLLRDAAGYTALLGICALALATLIGVPLGVFTGSRTGAVASAAQGVSLVLLSVPPFIVSLILLLVAVRTGWLPAGGLALAAVALALPIAASLERVQSSAMRDALRDPSLVAALARGIPRRRVVWRHALRLSLTPLLGIYGITIGAVLSGSFAVEIVMGWPGLGALTFQALRSRDIYLVAGCAASASLFLAVGILASDIALAVVDPRVEELA